MTTALAVRNNQLTPDAWQMIQAVAPVMKEARLFGVAKSEQAAAIMLKGHELGLGLTAAFEFIHIIQDKPSISPRGALALILQSGLAEVLKIDDNRDQSGKPIGCTVVMKRRGSPLEYTASFTMEDAKLAGLIKPESGWAKYPANMLRWRAIGYAADIVFPDVIGGMKRSDEMGADLTPDGDVIEGTWSQVNQRPVTVVTEQDRRDVASKTTLQTLISLHGAEKVLEANGGQIPATESEILEVMIRLNTAEFEP